MERGSAPGWSPCVGSVRSTPVSWTAEQWADPADATDLHVFHHVRGAPRDMHVTWHIRRVTAADKRGDDRTCLQPAASVLGTRCPL
jgi:hypothetical protein